MYGGLGGIGGTQGGDIEGKVKVVEGPMNVDVLERN
jgi:hypothetical protein